MSTGFEKSWSISGCFDAFINQWYLQEFLHYVDGNGPYKDQLYDGRPFLAMQKKSIINI